MALKGWILPTTTFDLPGGGTVAVRGLSVDQVAALVRDDREALTRVFEQVTGREDVQRAAEAATTGGEEMPEAPTEDPGMQQVVMDLLDVSPGLAAKVIAWSAGEPDAVDEALQIPAPTQLEILVEIGRLTFATTSPGKFMETVMALARGANQSMGALNTE